MSAAAAKGERTAQQLAEGLVERARSAGADEADAVASVSTESSVTVRMQKVEKIIEAGSRSVGLRVIMGGRQAVVSTSDISDAALDETVARALELALIAEPDEFAGLPEASETAGSGGSLQLYDEAIELVTTQDRIDRAMACEQAALDADERISNSDGASFSTQVSEMALANSNGFSGSYPTSSASLSVEVMAAEPDGRLRNDYWFTSERQLHRLADGAAVGREAAARALRQLGAEKTSTRQVPVVWEATMAAGLLGTVARAADGEAFFRRSTFFADREGEAVASSLVTIVDDATLAGQLGSRPFDGEGIATRRNVLVEDGVFGSFLFDTYNARRTGRSSTGSAVRGVGSLPGVGTGNLVMAAGATSPEALIAEVKEGLYLTTLMGFGTNIVTGDFSRGAAGLWIRDGKLAEPVTEINVSGRLQEMLLAIDAVGDDVQWFGSTAAPTLRMSAMMVSGS